MKSTKVRVRRPPLTLLAELGIALDSFQVEVAHEDVQVFTFLAHGQVGLGRRGELLEVVEHPQGQRVRVLEIAQWIQEPVDEGRGAITQVRWSDEGQDQIGPVLRTVLDQRLAETSGRGLDLEPAGRWIEDAPNTYGGVDEKAGDVYPGAARLQLKKVVGQADRRLDIVEEVANPRL